MRCNAQAGVYEAASRLNATQMKGDGCERAGAVSYLGALIFILSIGMPTALLHAPGGTLGLISLALTKDGQVSFQDLPRRHGPQGATFNRTRQ